MKCDIIIPVWNQLAYTRRCLESIRRHTEFTHRVIVIDNASDQGTKDYLGRVKWNAGQLLVITNPTNQGYVKAINQGLAASSHEFICLLNNDTVVTKGWLQRMVSLSQSNERIGIINPLGNVGRKIKDLTKLDSISSAISARKGAYLELESCSGFCMLFKRGLFEKVGYLDERFGTGYFEDTDYSERARQQGYLSVRALDSYVYHYIGTSFRRLKDRQQLFDKNKQLFLNKWGKVPQIIYPLAGISDHEDASARQYISTCHALARERCKVKSILGKTPFPLETLLSLNGLTIHNNLRPYSIRLLSRGKGKTGRCWNLAFAIYCLVKIKHLTRKTKADLLLVRDFDLACFLVKFKRYLNLPFILEVCDPGTFTGKGINKKEYVYHHLDAIICPNHSVKEKIAAQLNTSLPIYVVPEGSNSSGTDGQAPSLGQRSAWEERARQIIKIAQTTLETQEGGWP